MTLHLFAFGTVSVADRTVNVANGTVTLVFSHLGFTSFEAAVNNRAVVNVSMASSAKDLDDVVVVGYGTQRARNVTGSIVSVNTKKLEDLPVASLTEMLRGQVPGVNVSGGSTRPAPGRPGCRWERPPAGDP